VIEGAERVPDDLWTYANLPYLVDRVAGKGWSSVGDASGFLDPFYSPGIDQVSFSVGWTLELVKRSRMNPDPKEFAESLEEHNRLYRLYLRGLFEAIYLDKYHLMGDYDAMTASFLIDTALYYFFVAIPLYKRGPIRLLHPPFYEKYGRVPTVVIRAYQRRLISIARRKMKLGIYGNHNAGRRPRFMGFSLGIGAWSMLFHGVARWLRMELANAWTYIARPRPLKQGMPGPLAVPAEPEQACAPDEPPVPAGSRLD
jgi:hypothetical protein